LQLVGTMPALRGFIIVLLCHCLRAEYKWINNQWEWMEEVDTNEGSGGLISNLADDEDMFEVDHGKTRNGVTDQDDDLSPPPFGGLGNKNTDFVSHLQPFGSISDDEDFAIDGSGGGSDNMGFGGGSLDRLEPDDPYDREYEESSGDYINQRPDLDGSHTSNSYPKPIDVDSNYDPSDITSYGGHNGGHDPMDDDDDYDYSDEIYDTVSPDEEHGDSRGGGEDDDGISIDDGNVLVGRQPNNGFAPPSYPPTTSWTSSTPASVTTRRTTPSTLTTTRSSVSVGKQPAPGRKDPPPNVIDRPTNRPVSFFAQPGILAAVIGGAVVGLLCAILLVMFIVYRMRKKDEGSYILDEPKRVHPKRGKGEIYA